MHYLAEFELHQKFETQKKKGHKQENKKISNEIKRMYRDKEICYWSTM